MAVGPEHARLFGIAHPFVEGDRTIGEERLMDFVGLLRIRITGPS
jgi:hypothetical protein